MKNGLMLLGDGFEETEAISTHDILTRTHEISLRYVSISSSLSVVSSMGLTVQAQGLLSQENLANADFLVLPGGKKGVEALKASPTAMAAVKAFHEQAKPIYAICAAPSILGELGYLDGKTTPVSRAFNAEKATIKRMESSSMATSSPAIRWLTRSPLRKPSSKPSSA